MDRNYINLVMLIHVFMNVMKIKFGIMLKINKYVPNNVVILVIMVMKWKRNNVCSKVNANKRIIE